MIEQEEVRYEDCLLRVTNELRAKYGSISAFLRSPDADKTGIFTFAKAKTISVYLANPQTGQKKLVKSGPVLSALYKFLFNEDLLFSTQVERVTTFTIRKKEESMT